MADDIDEMIAALKGQAPVGPPVAPLIANAIEHTASLPQRAIQNSQFALDTGAYDPQPTMEAAAQLTTGGMPVAEAGAAGIFGGKLARTADLKALSEAKQMAISGKHPEDVWNATGWFRSPADKQWRFEIPDNNLKINHMPVGEDDTVSSIYAHNLVNHPELFQAYPELKSVQTSVTKDSRFPTGYGLYQNNGMGRSIGVPAPNSEAARSVMAHELQHGVQDLEGFSYGSDPSYYAGLIESGLKKRPDLLEGNKFRDVINQADKLYRGTAGEVEARNVQRRLDATPSNRLIAPWYTQDTPYINQYHHDPVTGMVKALTQK